MSNKFIPENALTVDVRGVLCPVPVIETKKVTDKNKETVVVTIVDNEVSRDNVVKFGNSQNYVTSVEKDGKDFYITLAPKDGNVGENTKCWNTISTDVNETTPIGKKQTAGKAILITKNYLGEGSEELGQTLMKTFLTTLNDVDHVPSKIYFINSGVKLVAEDGQNIESLQALAVKGVEIAACGICLNYYGLTEKVQVGSITNLYVIAEALLGEPAITL